MQYQVPQFIEVEDKLFGPLTFRQFVYLGGGCGLAYIAHSYIPSFFGIIIALLGIGLGLALAFLKINNKPFIYIMEAFFHFLIHPRLYVWRKVEPKKKKTVEKEATPAEADVPELSGNRLKDLAWSLDIHDRMQDQNGPGLTGQGGRVN